MPVTVCSHGSLTTAPLTGELAYHPHFIDGNDNPLSQGLKRWNHLHKYKPRFVWLTCLCPEPLCCNICQCEEQSSPAVVWSGQGMSCKGGEGAAVGGKKVLLISLKIIVASMTRPFSPFQWPIIVQQTTPQCGDINQPFTMAIRCSLDLGSSGGSAGPDRAGSRCWLSSRRSEVDGTPECGLGLWNLNFHCSFN